jgi:hypothetical protein
MIALLMKHSLDADGLLQTTRAAVVIHCCFSKENVVNHLLTCANTRTRLIVAFENGI